MHMYKASGNFFGGNGIVGAQVPLGTGLAFAHKYLGTGKVCFTYFGDGAANQGQVFEAFNMAALHKLPVVYVCENNQYGMGTAVHRASYSTEFYTRGDYIPGIQIDGMDVLVVREVGKWAVEFVKANGPLYIEAKTYRYQGHSMSDPGTTYRTREEIQRWRETRDPIELVKGRLLRYNLATEDELKVRCFFKWRIHSLTFVAYIPLPFAAQQQIDKEVKAEVDEAVEFAKTSPEPTINDLWTDVYTDDMPIRGTELVNGYKYR